MSEARHWAAKWLGGHDIPPAVIDDTVLCLSEVVTNAVQHHLSAEPLCVRLSVLPDCVYFSVRDDNNAEPVRRVAGDDDDGGRGLAVLDAYTSQWGVTPFHRGKSVWCEVPRQSADVPVAGVSA
ncbi:ATP-binding protein [Yinghuangia aomiensis]